MILWDLKRMATGQENTSRPNITNVTTKNAGMEKPKARMLGWRNQQTYDDLNRLTSIEEYALFTYTPDSLVDTLTYANGVVTTLSYDQCHRPLSISAEKEGEVLLSLEYTYDFVGNITEIIRDWIDPVAHLPQTATESYTYDALDRVLSATNGFGMLSYAAVYRVQYLFYHVFLDIIHRSGNNT
jgi:hypothetical protein